MDSHFAFSCMVWRLSLPLYLQGAEDPSCTLVLFVPFWARDVSRKFRAVCKRFKLNSLQSTPRFYFLASQKSGSEGTVGAFFQIIL